MSRALVVSFPGIVVFSLLWLVPSLPPGHAAAPSGHGLSVSARLEPAKIYVDQRAVLEVEIAHPGDARALVFPDSILPALDGVRIAGRSTTVETQWEGGHARTVVRHRLSLAPQRTGIVAADTLWIAWKDPATGKGGRAAVEAGMLRVVERPAVLRVVARHPVQTLAGFGLLAGGVGVLVWLWNRRRGAGAGRREDLGPEAALEQDWRRLRILAARGELGTFSEEAALAVRRFAEKRYGITARGLPTPALAEVLEGENAPAVVVNGLREVLNFADDMKFALWTPTHQELEKILSRIRQLWWSWEESRGRQG